MSIQTTISLLKELGLHGMAESFEDMMKLPSQRHPALDRAVEKMVQTEVCTRDKKLTEKFLKAAKLRYKVFIEDITCSTERNLTESQLAEVADCNFVRRGDNLLITGLTGCGKSYLACALGNQASAGLEQTGAAGWLVVREVEQVCGRLRRPQSRRCVAVRAKVTWAAEVLR